MTNDEKIKNVMDSLKTDLPPGLEAEVEEMIRTESKRRPSLKNRIIPLLKWSPAAAAALFLMIMGLSEMNRPMADEKPLREVRIQYDLKEKNIKILWVKKEGFVLKRRDK